MFLSLFHSMTYSKGFVPVSVCSIWDPLTGLRVQMRNQNCPMRHRGEQMHHNRVQVEVSRQGPVEPHLYISRSLCAELSVVFTLCM